MNLLTLGKNTLSEFSEDNCTTLAAAIAYSAFFSIFPLLLGMVALLGAFVESPDVRERVLNSALAYLPGSREMIGNVIEGVSEKRGTVGLVSAVWLLISGRGVFQAVIHGVSVAFETKKERGFIQTTLLAIGLIFGFGGLMLLSLIVTAAMQVIGTFEIPVFDLGQISQSPLWGVVQTAITAFVTFLAFMVLYKIGPNMDLRWREILPGAAMAAILFEVAKWGFVLYIRNFPNEAVYGTIGAVIALLTWCYFSALILLIGAEVASEYTKLRRAERREFVVNRPGPIIPVEQEVPVARRAAAVAGTLAATAATFAAMRGTRRSKRIA